MEKEDKIKNVKDLEYSRTLNLENVFIALVGGAVITVLLSEVLPFGLSKLYTITSLGALFVSGLAMINKKLGRIIKDIEKI